MFKRELLPEQLLRREFPRVDETIRLEHAVHSVVSSLGRLNLVQYGAALQQWRGIATGRLRPSDPRRTGCSTSKLNHQLSNDRSQMSNNHVSPVEWPLFGSDSDQPEAIFRPEIAFAAIAAARRCIAIDRLLLLAAIRVSAQTTAQ